MQTKNALSEICELGIRINTGTPENGEVNCVAELRIYKGDILLGNEECEITISKATISIDIEGLEPIPGTRYGEPRTNNSVPISKNTQQKKTRETKYSFGGGGKINPNTATIALEANASKSGSFQQESHIEAAEVTEHLKVRAIPSLRWIVSEPHNDPLDATYLESNTLFSMGKILGANRRALTASVTVKQRDLNIREIIIDDTSRKFFNRISVNQRRLLDIFIAKSLSTALGWNKNYKGEILLSEHSCEIEDEE